MDSRRRITISDVAKKAGVSIATVSRVLNGTDYPVKDSLRKAVLRAAEQMNYTPNFFGRSLKSGKSNDIGVILPSMINPFYSEVIAGTEKECRDAGYNPIFCSSNNEPEKELEQIRLMRKKCVEGLLISTINADSGPLRRYIMGNSNVVLFDQPAEGLSCGSVGYDFTLAGALAAHYLTGKDHRRIAFLSPPLDRPSRRAIFKGFRRALEESDVGFRPEDLIVLPSETALDEKGNYEFENGHRLARAFLKMHCPATAAVAINDITAFGVIQELLRSGRRVPGDISVMGFDNINFSAMVNPALTTVSQPSFEMGRLAARVLIGGLQKADRREAAEHILLKPEVIERESVCTLRPGTDGKEKSMKSLDNQQKHPYT